MKKLLFILLLPMQLFAQVEFLGLVTIQDTVFYDNTEVFALLKTLPEGLKTKDNAEVIFIPEWKYANMDSCYLIDVDGYYYFYTYNEKSDKITIEPPIIYLAHWSLKNKRIIEKKQYSNDIFDSIKPKNVNEKDLEKIIKAEHKKKKKNNTGNINSGQDKPKEKIR